MNNIFTINIGRLLRRVLLLSVLGSAAQADVFDPTFGTPVDELQVPLNQSRILLFSDNVENLSVGNPDVADLIVLEANKIYVVGKSLGSTNVVVWERGATQKHTTFKVNVVHDIDALKQTIHTLMPNEKPEIYSTHGSIILSGEITTAEKIDAIIELTEQFVNSSRDFSKVKPEANNSGGAMFGAMIQKPNIVNLMRQGGPSQVMLEVKVAEVSRSVMKQLGVNMAAMDPGSPWTFGAVNGGATLPPALTPDGLEVPLFPRDGNWLNTPVIGPSVQDFTPNVPAISSTGLLFSFLTGGSYFNLVVDASRDDGLTKILAEPTLTTLSGEQAQFLSGGQFPIPVANGNNGNVSVDYKDFGVGVKFVPVVLDSERINLNLNVTVSEISGSTNVNLGIPGSNVAYVVPSLTTRTAASTVELKDGQTIGIAGLISDRMRENINKFPGLGDIPILGALFRSQQYISEQTELVMFVTARLARPIERKNIRLPTENFENPTDAEFYLMGKMASKKEKKNENSDIHAETEVKVFVDRGTSGGTATSFGHVF